MRRLRGLHEMAFATLLMVVSHAHAASPEENAGPDQDATEIENELSASVNKIPFLDLIRPASGGPEGLTLQLDEPQLLVAPVPPAAPAEPASVEPPQTEADTDMSNSNGPLSPDESPSNPEPDLVISSQSDDVSIQILRTHPAPAAKTSPEPPSALTAVSSTKPETPAQQVATEAPSGKAPKEFKVLLKPMKKHQAGKKKSGNRQPASLESVLDSAE